MSAHVWRGIIEEYRSHLPVSEQTPVITLREGGHAAGAGQPGQRDDRL